MTISMHSASVPVFVRILTAQLGWLEKARAHAQARNFSPDNYLVLRLAPDMLPFTKQIHIACDQAKACVARLAGQEVPKWQDDETTLDELCARIRKTIDYVQSVPAAQFEGSDGREILVPTRQGEPLRFTGEAYLKHYVLPNFYFHVTTAYALLRQAGADIGKKDFLA